MIPSDRHSFIPSQHYRRGRWTGPRGWLSSLLSSLVALLVILGPMSGSTQSSTENLCTVTERTANLDFVLQDMNGNDVALGDYAGDVILLDFWATWCAPCRIEIPGFIEMIEDYGPRGFTVLGVSIDDTQEALQLYAAELGMNYPVLVGSERDDIKDEYGPLIGFPTSFIIDRDGRICHRHVGYAAKESFVREIEALL